MQRRTKLIVGTAALAGLAAFPVAALAGGQESESERDVPITGQELEKASAAALAHLGGGRVTGTEVEDEESYYEVEVTLADGSQVDVQLDEKFRVVGSENDGAGEVED